MRFRQLFFSLLCGLALSGGVPSRAADIVYDNSALFSGIDYETTAEYGDQVILAGTARAVTEIQIEYYAEFTPQGDELGRVRFYSNTGPNWRDNPDYPRPASPPLFEQTFSLGQGYQTAVISVPNVVVPDTFTWTVQFLGITQTSSTDRAGLLFYDVPDVGASYDDFWELTQEEGWAPVARDDVPKNNFAARIIAVQGAEPMRLTITRVGNNILITWPSSDSSFRLEAKSNLNTATWSLVSQTPTLNGARYEVVLPIGGTNQFFRLRSP